MTLIGKSAARRQKMKTLGTVLRPMFKEAALTT